VEQNCDDDDKVGTLMVALQRAGVNVCEEELRQTLAEQLHSEGMLVEHVELLANHFEKTCHGDRYRAAGVLAGKLKIAGVWRKIVGDIRAFHLGFGRSFGPVEVNRPLKPFESKAGRDSYVRYLHNFEGVSKETLAEQIGSTVEDVEDILTGDLE